MESGCEPVYKGAIVGMQTQAPAAERRFVLPPDTDRRFPMSSVPPHDGAQARPQPSDPEPDAHGQAALLLAESILHALVEKSTLSVPEAIAVVQIAAEVKVEVATLARESEGRMQASLDLLSRIAQSFETDERQPG